MATWEGGLELDLREDDKSILVCGLNTDYDEEALMDVFEDTEYCPNGGKVESVYRNGKDDTAVVKFESEKVASRVLAMGKVDILGEELILKKYEQVKPDVSTTTVRVKGLPKNTNEKKLMLIFQSKNKGGGPIESINIQEKTSDAIIVFKNHEDAENVVKKSQFKLRDGSILETEWYVPTKEETLPQRSVLMTGLTEDLDEDCIEAIIQEMEQAQGAKIEEITINKKRQSAVVVFDDIVVAKQLQSVGCYRGPADDMELSLRVYDSATDPADIFLDVEEEQQADEPDSQSNTVLITGLPKTTSQDRLRAFFERKTRGGPIYKLDITSQNRAVISFVDSKDATTVVAQKKFKMQQSEISAEWYIPEAVDDTVVLVENILESMDQDYLEDMFVNEAMTGGGEIEHIELMGSKATMKFKSSEVAARVADKGQIKTDEGTLKVRLSTGDDDLLSAASVVELTGLPDSITPDRVKLHMENRRRIDGGTVKSTWAENGKMFVGFVNPRDAVKVAKLVKFQISEHTVTVRLHNADNEEENPKAIQVDGLQNKVDEDTLENLFENKMRSRGGPLESVILSPDKKRATLIFENADDASSVLEQKSLSIGNITLAMSRPSKVGRSKTRLSMDEAESKVTEEDNKPPDPYEVTNIGPTTVAHLIQLYFKDKSSSGGGEIEKLSFSACEGRAIIQFKHAKDSNDVWERYNSTGLVLNDRKLLLKQLDSSKLGSSAFSVNSCAIEVTNIPSSYKDIDDLEDALRMLFENTNMTGGGKIEKLYLAEDLTRAVITFKEPEVTGNVMDIHNSKAIVLDEQKLYVKHLPIAGGQTNPEGILEDCKLFLQNLSEDVENEEIQYIFSKNGGANVVNIIYGLKVGKALLEFDTIPDFDQIFQYLRMKPIKGNMISFQRVAQSKAIEVYNISTPNKLSNHKLQMYFEHGKSGSNSTVDNIRRIENNDCAIVTFENVSGVQGVLSKDSHQYERQCLKVQHHYSCIGILPPGHNTKIPTTTIPTEITVPVTKLEIINFIINKPQHKSDMTQKVKEMNAIIAFPKADEVNDGSSLTITCTLTKDVKGYQALAKVWIRNIEELLEKYMEKYSVAYVSVSKQGQEESLEETKKMNSSDVSLQYDSKKCEVVIVGFVQNVEETSEVLSKKMEEIEKEIERRKQITEETLTHDQHKAPELRVLYRNDIASQLENKFRDLSVKIDIETRKITYRGVADDIKEAKLQMYAKLNEIKSSEKELADEVRKMLKKHDIKSYVDERFAEQNIKATYEVKLKKVIFFSLSDTECNSALSIIEKSIKRQQFKLADSKLLKSAKWKQKKADLIEEHGNFISVTESTSSLVIVATDNIMDYIYDHLSEYFESNTIKEEFVPAKLGVVRAIANNDQIVQRVQEEFEDISLRINCDENTAKPGLKVKGSNTGLPKAVEEVNNSLIKRVQHKKYVVDKPGMATYFEEEVGKQMLKTIENSTKTAIEMSKEKEEDTYSTNFEHVDILATVPFLPPTRKEIATVDVGIKVVLLQDDITAHRVDCIMVPTTDVTLKPTDRIGKKLSEKAGSSIQDDCDAYVKRRGRLLHSDVYISMAGRLSCCNRLIHTVFPEWQGGNSNEETFIFEAVIKAMKTASKQGFREMSMPASVLETYKPEISISLFASALRAYWQTGNQFSLKEVHIIADGPVTKKLAETLALHLEPGSPRTSITSPPTLLLARVHDSSGETYKAAADPSVVTIAGLTVTLVKGAIAQQKVDVIVNTANVKLQLKFGAVSNSLFEAGGKVMQDECDKIVKQGFSFGQLAETSAGKLKCKRVYHGSCDSYTTSGALQLMEKFIDESLKHASGKGMTSMAFPAIGTGNLGYPKDVVAKTMYERVKLFTQSNARSSLQDIRFIVYDKDKETIKAFESEIKNVTSAPPPAVKPKLPPLPPTRITSFASPSVASAVDIRSSVAANRTLDVRAATLMPPMASNAQINIGKMSLQVRQGDITKEKLDAIVNSTNSKMDFSSMVSKAILKAGGEAIRKECEKNPMRDNISITGAGKLKCKKIIHINAPGHTQKDWKERILQCLKLAEDNKLQSIALPAVGTGKLGNPVSIMAETIMDATADFSNNSNPQHLHKIRLVIFEPKMVGEFETNLQKIASSEFGKKKGFSLMGIVKGIFGYVDDQSNAPVPTRATHYTTTPSTSAYAWLPPSSESEYEVIPAAIAAAADVTAHACEIKSLDLVIYGFDSSCIQSAIASIEKICIEQSGERLIEGYESSEKIKKLTDDQIRKIKMLQSNYEVRINVNKGYMANRILIQGRKKDTAEVYVQIREVLFEAEKKEMQNKLEEDLYAKVQWLYERKPGTYEDYPRNINYLIETAYNTHQSDAQWNEKEGSYVVTFANMQEHVTGNASATRRVRRNAPDSIALPANWEKMKDSDNHKVIDVVLDDHDYEIVLTKFKEGITETNDGILSNKYSTISDVQVKSIKRIQNPRIYRICMARRKQAEISMPSGQPFERELWHGTSCGTTEKININGFNRSFCGKNATAYGNGVYFAVNANYSHRYAEADADGTRTMYLCKVITGEYTKGKSGLLCPPDKDPKNPNIQYDSVVDNIMQPNMYVVFYDDQAYPEYAITYTTT